VITSERAYPGGGARWLRPGWYRGAAFGLAYPGGGARWLRPGWCRGAAFGLAYPGGGGTLAPAVVFGYVAGQSLTGWRG
jgi:hypothetical protein